VSPRSTLTLIVTGSVNVVSKNVATASTVALNPAGALAMSGP